jgi:hypothetical protein
MPDWSLPDALKKHGYDGAVRCWSCSEAFNLANAGSIPVRVTEALQVRQVPSWVS